MTCAALARSYRERQSLRASGVASFGISHVTVLQHLKKSARSRELQNDDCGGLEADDVLEADELFTFVQVKVQRIRLWLVICRRTRQILSFFPGDGSMESCKRLWRKLPYAYLRCRSFSDFWRAYNCVPTATHQLVGKETGETAHIERLNNTLRQRLSRPVRKTLSFSKKEYMLNLHVKLFAVHYNLGCINY